MANYVSVSRFFFYVARLYKLGSLNSELFSHSDFSNVGFVATIELLLKAGADAKYADLAGLTALHYTVSFSGGKFILLLLLLQLDVY